MRWNSKIRHPSEIFPKTAHTPPRPSTQNDLWIYYVNNLSIWTEKMWTTQKAELDLLKSVRDVYYEVRDDLKIINFKICEHKQNPIFVLHTFP